MDVRPPARRCRGARCPVVLLFAMLLCASAARVAAQEPDFPYRAHVAHGDVAAIEQFAAANPLHPDVPVALALIDRARGDDEPALARLRDSAQAGHVDAALELGLLLMEVGQRAEARAAFEALGGALRPDSDGMTYARTARAVAAIGDPRQANALYRAALERDSANPIVHAWWGDLFLSRHEDAEAVRAYRDAIARDDKWAPAHLGLARALASSDPAASAASLARALAIDPLSIDAEVMTVDRALDADRLDDAKAALARAESSGARRYDVQVRKAVVTLLEDRGAEFDALASALVARRPASGEVFRAAAAAMARQYRFDDAVAMGRRATEVDGQDTRAWAELGMHLSRAGDESGAYEALSRAFRNDPYDPVTYNLLNMLETLNTFAAIEHEGVTIRMHPNERELLEPYVRDIITRAFDSFETRYGLRPAAPLSVQIFNQHDDFAVRTAGLPGILTNALGVCFGRVVAMVSPRARQPGTFSWQETLWHELAHVVSLQLSNQRVPRWLTEGMSVYEERRGREGWGREGDLGFARALADGGALSLADLEGGFTQAQTIGLAYYEASLLVEHIEQREGLGAIRRMLAAYGEGLDTPAVIERVLGMSLATLDARFFADMRAQYAPLIRALAPDGGPDSFPALLAIGDAMLSDGNAEGARSAYERAAGLVPRAAGDSSPHLRLAGLALKRGDRSAARAALSAALDADYSNVEIARRLATLAREDGDRPSALLASARIIEIDPFDPAAHTSAGRDAMAAGDLVSAEREFRAAIAAGAVNLPDAHCDLGELLLAQGRNDDARRHAIRALENAPTFERAQELLLKAVGKQP